MFKLNTYMSALVAGIIIYIILEFDKKYFNDNEESSYYSSLRIASVTTLLVWTYFMYFCIDTDKPSTDEILAGSFD